MKRLLTQLKMAIAFGVLIFGFNACQKETAINPTTGSVNTSSNSITAADNSADPSLWADQSAEDMSDILDEAYFSSLAKKTSSAGSILASGCATIVQDHDGDLNRITVDFGPKNCMGSDGVNRRGRVVMLYNGAYRDPGTTLQYFAYDFYVNDVKIEGFKKVANVGLNNANNIHFNIYSEITVTMTDGTVISQEALRDREWISGYSTLETNDDVYNSTGSALTTKNGVQYHSDILTPLRKEVGYRFLVDGKNQITLMKENKKTIIDYGYPKQGRDNLALATYNNGSTRVIILH